MKEKDVREMLYRRYIEPLHPKQHKYVGIEVEIPIVNLDKAPVDFGIVHRITGQFLQRFQFQPMGIDEEGNVYAAREDLYGDVMSFDCSYNNLEFSLGRELSLHAVWQRFSVYYQFWQEQLSDYHYTLTGMGINPYRRYNHNVPIPVGRYRMLYHHLHSYKNYSLPMYFHPYPEFGTFASASQVQLDIDSPERLLKTISAFSKLEPIKALLFSNSVLTGEDTDLVCARDMLWENSTHGINPHNVGMYECEFDTIDEFLDYLESTSLYCVERGDKYINFPPVNLVEYFQKEKVSGEYYAEGRYHSIEIHPKAEDIEYLRTFKHEDLTFRGTVEFRSVCCQPVRDCMTVAAFHVGLNTKLDELYDLLETDHVIYHRGYNKSELRKLLVKKEIPGFVDQEELYALCEKVLDLAREGLLTRGHGEEALLAPLYGRVRQRTNPAKEMLERLENGEDMQNIILDYGKI